VLTHSSLSPDRSSARNSSLGVAFIWSTSTVARPAGDVDAALLEMFVPLGVPGVEQRHDLPILRVDAGQVRALVQVAVLTREGEVPGIVAAAVLLRDHVFDVKAVERGVAVVKSATHNARPRGRERGWQRLVHSLM
jgi:hypothetical protein